MEIYALSEGSFTIGSDKIFVPFSAGTDHLSQRSTGSLLVEVQPFCVVTNRDVLLLDTGLGFTKGGTLQIHENLLAVGIQPYQVTKVLMSHLHKDHAGGISYHDNLGNYQLAFPNAAYFVQRREYDFAEQSGFPSFVVDEFSIFDHHPNVFWLHDDKGTIDHYIKYEVNGGHSPYHQSFWIEENGQTLFFGGDNAPQLNQMRSKAAAKYDFDGKKAMELRQHWWKLGQQENWTFLFYHDIQHAIVNTSNRAE